MLLLIGLRASGKSTVGRLLASKAGVPFIDLDDVTPLMAVSGGVSGNGGTGRVTRSDSPESAADILRARGEPYFRQCEELALRRVATDPINAGAVLALGGGTPTDRQSYQTIKSFQRRGVIAPYDRLAGQAPCMKPVKIVYLRATPATLSARLADTDLSTRPSLTGKGVLEEIAELFERRDPLYRSLADATIDVDSLDSPQAVVQRIDSSIGSEWA